MTEQDKQEYKAELAKILLEQQDDFMMKAYQSGKQETSNLVVDILHKIEPVVKESIEKTVNGKINVLTAEFREHREQDMEYKKAANLWKERFTPALETLEKTGHWASTTGWLLKGMILIGGAIGAIYAFLNIFHDK